MPRYYTNPNAILKIIRMPEDVMKMLQYTNKLEERAIVSFLWLTAARVSEMLAVKLNDVYITPSTVKISIPTLKKVRYEEQKFKALFRTLEFPTDDENSLFVDVLINYYRYRKQEALEGEPLFDRTRQYVTYLINRLSQMAYGVRLSAHHIRHARLSYLAFKGFSAWQLKYIKGAADLRSVEEYVHIQPQLIKV